MSAVASVDVFDVVDTVLAAVVAELDTSDPESLIESVQSLDQLANMVEARRAQLFSEIAGSGAYLHDGHANTRVAVRHVGKLANATSLTRQRNARMARALPLVAAA